MRKSGWSKLSIVPWVVLAGYTVSMVLCDYASAANTYVSSAPANVAVNETAKSENKKTVLNNLISIGDEKNNGSGEIYKKGVGLQSEDLRLINQGRFVELSDKLSKQVLVEGGQFNRKAAWLAFSYLYLQKCDELKKLNDSVPGQNGQTQLTVNSALVQVFSLLCEKKLDEAEHLLQGMPAPAMNDAFVNYAFATLAGKQSKPQVSIAYTKRAVELAPDFAWGYRTIAFLQEKWLNQNGEAAKNYAKALEIEPRQSDATGSLINLYLAVNNYDQAIAVARDAIKHDDKSTKYYVLADIYLRQWRLQEAAQQLRKAIAIDKSNSEYRRLLALILQTQGNKEEALEEEKLAVSYSKNKSNDLVDLATMQLNAGKQDEAVASLKQALDLDANNMKAAAELTNLLVQMKHFDELADTLNKCAAKLPKNEAVRLHLGDALSAAGKTDLATEAYKDAANLNPNDAEPHTRIAAMLVSKKDYEGAAKEYTRSLNINSNSVANLVALGGCEAEMDDYLKAEAAFVTALALHQLTQPVDSVAPPTRTQIIRGLAALLFREGRYADAASQFVSLCEMDKDPATKNLNKFMYAQAVALRDLSKDSFKQLEDAYGALSNEEKNNQKINYIDTLLRSNHYDQSLSLLKNLVEYSSTGPGPSGHWLKDPFYYICLSRAYTGKGDIVKAEEMAKQAIVVCDKENSPHSDAFCQLGEVLLAKGDLEGAEKNTNAALGLNTKAFRAYVLLGNIAMQRKQIKMAVEAANKAIEIDPYLIDAYLLLGNAQMAQGDQKGALNTFHKAVDLYPGLLQTHQSLLPVLQKLGTKDEISREQAAIAGLKSKE